MFEDPHLGVRSVTSQHPHLFVVDFVRNFYPNQLLKTFISEVGTKRFCQQNCCDLEKPLKKPFFIEMEFKQIFLIFRIRINTKFIWLLLISWFNYFSQFRLWKEKGLIHSPAQKMEIGARDRFIVNSKGMSTQLGSEADTKFMESAWSKSRSYRKWNRDRA